MSITEVSKKHNEWLKEMGWVGVTTPLEKLALITEEIGECVKECRGETPTNHLKYELADIILRTLGMAESLNIDIESAILEKMELNKARGNLGRLK